MRITFITFTIAVLFSAVSIAQQKIIFNEDFEGYANDWTLVNNEEFNVKQEAGKLSISKTNINRVANGCLWYKKTINGFDTAKDFNIEFDAKSISSETESVYFDIQWGRIQEFDGVRKKSIYQLDFGNNNVRLAKFASGKNWKYYSWSKDLYDQTLSEFIITKDVFNKFEIRQIDGVLSVWINKKLVYKMSIDYLVGSEIGIQQCLKGEWELDNLIIKQ
jgi:hypothetical protein